MTSIIIPAHNEELALPTCLDELLRDSQPGEFEVIVVANGCSDRTAEVAAARSGVQVIDSPVPSKAHALNLGDQAARSFPRLFVDADVRLDSAGVRATADALRKGALAAAPRLNVDLRGASAAVRAYYRIWRRTAYVESGLIGSGVYGISEEGRARFESFPYIIADDLFIYSLFTQGERVTVDAEFVITPPKRLAQLIEIKTRVFAGNLEHKARFPHSHQPSGSQLAGVLRTLPMREWPAAAVYVGVQMSAKLRGRRKFKSGDLTRWERDDSGRQSMGRS